jgi:hypothetical protein
VTTRLRHLPTEQSVALGWHSWRGRRCRFRAFDRLADGTIDSFGPFDHGSKNPESRYAKVLDGRTWFAFDYGSGRAQLDTLGPIGWLLKGAERGRGRPVADDVALSYGLSWLVFDHAEFLESEDGERRIVSHLNVPELVPDARERLIALCKRWNLTWMQVPPPGSWSDPDRCMLTITRGPQEPT